MHCLIDEVIGFEAFVCFLKKQSFKEDNMVFGTDYYNF